VAGGALKTFFSRKLSENVRLGRRSKVLTAHVDHSCALDHIRVSSTVMAGEIVWLFLPHGEQLLGR